MTLLIHNIRPSTNYGYTIIHYSFIFMIIRCQDSAGQATGKAHVCFIKHPKGSTLARGLTWRNLRKAGKFKKNKSTSSTTIFCGP